MMRHRSVGFYTPLYYFLTALACVSTCASATISLSRPFPSERDRNIIDVEVVGKEDRQTEEAYAIDAKVPMEEVRRRFGATGQLICKNDLGSAQVTVKKNVITTSAHIFFDYKTCRIKNRPEDCTFNIADGNSILPIRVKQLLAIGFKCSDRKTFEHDWAILELQHVIENVNPYRMPTRHRYPVVSTMPIVAVAVGQRDFVKIDSRGIATKPKSIGVCEVKSMYAGSEENIGGFGTDCDQAEGGSGGSILWKHKDAIDYELVGIISGFSEKKVAQNRQTKINGVKLCEYDKDKCAVQATAVSGELFRALTKFTQ